MRQFLPLSAINSSSTVYFEVEPTNIYEGYVYEYIYIYIYMFARISVAALPIVFLLVDALVYHETNYLASASSALMHTIGG